MKKYIAKTNISINIVLKSGKNRHITFSALTGGGSVFYTDDPEIQKAMECHYKFGKLFRVDQKYVAEKQRNKPAPKPKPEIVPEQPTVSAAPIPIGETPTPTVEEAEDTPVGEAEDTPVGEAEDTPVGEAEDTPAGEATVAVSDSEQATAEDIDSDGQPEEAEAEAEDNGLKTIVVSDPDAAKAYLAEHFGISRTKIKSVKAIKVAAAANGIVFEGI